MRSIEKQLERAEISRRESDNAQRVALGATAKATEEYIELRRRILDGETLGCPIHDYAIAGPFDLSDRILALAQAAETYLKTQIGQLALVQYDELLPGANAFNPGRYYGWHVALGSVQGSQLSEMQIGVNRYCALPVFCHQVISDDRGGLIYSDVRAQFALDWRKTYIFGDDAVLIWMEENRPEFDMTPLMIDLGKIKAPEGILEA